MMDFEEYVSANYKRLEGQTRELVEDAFKAGQQSKQAEIDKVKELLNQWDNWISFSANHNCIEIVKECADELRELLK